MVLAKALEGHYVCCISCAGFTREGTKLGNFLCRTMGRGIILQSPPTPLRKLGNLIDARGHLGGSMAKCPNWEMLWVLITFLICGIICMLPWIAGSMRNINNCGGENLFQLCLPCNSGGFSKKVRETERFPPTPYPWTTVQGTEAALTKLLTVHQQKLCKFSLREIQNEDYI